MIVTGVCKVSQYYQHLAPINTKFRFLITHMEKIGTDRRKNRTTVMMGNEVAPGEKVKSEVKSAKKNNRLVLTWRKK